MGGGAVAAGGAARGSRVDARVTYVREVRRWSTDIGGSLDVRLEYWAVMLSG